MTDFSQTVSQACAVSGSSVDDCLQALEETPINQLTAKETLSLLAQENAPDLIKDWAYELLSKNAMVVNGDLLGVVLDDFLKLSSSDTSGKEEKLRSIVNACPQDKLVGKPLLESKIWSFQDRYGSAG